MFSRSLALCVAVSLLTGCNLFLSLDPVDSENRSETDQGMDMGSDFPNSNDMDVVDDMDRIEDMSGDADMGPPPEGNWIAIGLGDRQGCGIARGGQAYCWGANDHGQLGTGDDNWYIRPTAVDSTEAFVDIVVGGEHACATTADDRLFCWGDDDNFGSILGDGNNLISPTQFTNPGFVEIVAGFSHTCGRTADNQMYCLGEDDFGQTGFGLNGDIGLFTLVPNVETIDIAAGHQFTCYLDLEGKPWCWGREFWVADYDDAQTFEMPYKVSDDVFVSISAGNDHVCALDANNSAWCWGLPSWIGTLTTSMDKTIPSQVLTGLEWKELHSGEQFTCGLAMDDQVYCWGGNRRGKLANGEESSTDSPVNPIAPIVMAGPFTGLAVGTNHGCVLDQVGDAHCWGHNNQGRVGIGVAGETATPQLVNTDQTFVKTVSGEYSSCALTDTGDVYCWGRGNYNALGNGSLDHQLTPAQVTAVSGATDLVMSSSNVCAVVPNDVLCWGSGNYGVLGQGNRNDQVSPVSLGGPETLVQLTLGNQTACGVSANNTGYCWGYGPVLADMTDNTYYTTPTPLSMNHGPYKFLATSSTDHFCGIDPSDDAYCWGDNGDGELGDGMGGPGTYIDMPVAVTGGLKWKTIDLGNEVTCGITTGDAGYCWGEGNQHGLGTGSSIMVPTELSAGETWLNIDMHGSGGCGATTSGEVYCWGSNNRQRMGFTFGSSSSPRQVSGITDAIWVSLGDSNACAATASGDTYCWGARTHGRLGDGINAIIYEPTPIDMTDVDVAPLE